MKIIVTVVYAVIVLSGIILIPNAFAESIPDWVKNNAGWWAEGQIDDSSFVSGIEWLVLNDIIEVPPTTISVASESTVPNWVKNTSGWWANNQISDNDFVNAIQYLIKIGIMKIPQADNTLADSSPIKPSSDILNTTSFFEVIVERHGFINKSVDFEGGVMNPRYNEYPEDVYTINSDGFRGPEFNIEKPDNTFRVIAVGGSTTFGIGVKDGSTWPSILDDKLQNLIEGIDIEVINAGIPAIGSLNESKLIKGKLVRYEPDMIIIYDGANDAMCKLVEHITKNHANTEEYIKQRCGVYSPNNYQKVYAERWSDVCELGKKNGFETVFILQPSPHFDKILTDQEFKQYFLRAEHTFFLDAVDSFAQQIKNMKEHCTVVADFRDAFDYHLEPLYFDYVHVNHQGNEILASKIIELISPILQKEGVTKQIPPQPSIIKPFNDPDLLLRLYEANWGNLTSNQAIFLGQNLTGQDFSNSDLKDKIFFGSDLSGANFENSVLSGSDFSLANLENANFKNAVIDGIKLRQTNLDYTDFSNVNFHNVDVINVDFTNTILKNSNLSNKDLTKTFLYKSDLSGANLSGSDLSLVYLGDTVLKDANLTNALLYEADLSLALDKDLSGTVIVGAVITHSNLVGVDFSGKDLSAVNFFSSDLTGQDFTNNITFFNNSFMDAELSNANFEGVDIFTGELFSTTFKNKAHLQILSHDEIADEVFESPGHRLVFSTEIRGNDLVVNYIFFVSFKGANLENASFKNADLKFTNFYLANLANADLSGADLTKAYLGKADLSNANLEGANLQGAILDNTIFTGANLKCINHPICESG